MTKLQIEAMKKFLGYSCYFVEIGNEGIDRRTATALAEKGFIHIGETMAALLPNGAQWLKDNGLIKDFRPNNGLCYIKE